MDATGRRRASGWTGTLAMAALMAAGCGPAPEATPSADEARLANGVRLDLQGRCEPFREDLPSATLVAIQCSTADERSGVRLYLFNRQEELLEAYVAILEAEGIEPRMDLGDEDGREMAYVPGDEPGGPLTATRHAWFLDGLGHARYVATLPPFVLATAESLDQDPFGLYNWSWLGNQDVPGAPTLWRDGTPVNPADGGKG